VTGELDGRDTDAVNFRNIAAPVEYDLLKAYP